MWDFSAVISKNRDARAELFGQLRDLYDGRISKQTGMDNRTIEYGSGGVISYLKNVGTRKDPEWEERSIQDPKIHCSFITACTPSIDFYTAEHDALGTRFLQFRLKEVDNTSVMEKIDQVNDKVQKGRDECKAVVTQFFLDYRPKPLEISSECFKRLHKITDFLCKMRTPVMVSRYDGSVECVVSSEGAGRAYAQLSKLLRALLQLDGYDEEAALSLLWRIALSSATASRMKVFACLKGRDTPVTASNLYQEVRMGEKPIRRELNALYALDVVDNKNPFEYGTTWWVTDEWRDVDLSTTLDKKESDNSDFKQKKRDAAQAIRDYLADGEQRPAEDLLQLGQNFGLDDCETGVLIDEMRKGGEIFEPRHERYALTEGF